METGLGIDSRFALSDDEQRTIAREAAGLGYTSLWTPIGNTREPFDICMAWYASRRLPPGIAVAPFSAWTIDQLAAVSKETLERTDGKFTLGIGTGRTADAPIRVMREAIDALRARLPGTAVYLGALGPQMLRLAGKRCDGAALNWCSADQVRWSRERNRTRARADLPGRASSIGRLLGSTGWRARGISSARSRSGHRGRPTRPGAAQRSRGRATRGAGVRAEVLVDLLGEAHQVAEK